MREINKTIYELVKQSNPDEGVSVTQLITDEVVKQSDSDQLSDRKKEDATGLLNLKATQLEQERGKSSSNVKKALEASAQKAKEESKEPVVTKKKVTKKVPGTGVKKVKKKVKKKVSKKKKVVKKKNSNTTQVLLLVLIIAIGAYLYLELA